MRSLICLRNDAICYFFQPGWIKNQWAKRQPKITLSKILSHGGGRILDSSKDFSTFI